MKASVILSTYNQPEWLAKVLIGYRCQDTPNFELVIADDGSGPETLQVIENFRKDNPQFSLQHIWHEDRGFQKTKILNKGILAAQSDYLIFSDGDCIPRADFISTHLQLSRQGSFLSGGYCKLPLSTSQTITSEDIVRATAFQLSWLKQQGLKKRSAQLKIGLPLQLGKLADILTPTKATWNGMNSSAYKEDLLSVNGFNETMQYGGEDRELGERLWNKGLTSQQIRHRAILLHLDHERSYIDPQMLESNKQIRDHTITNKLVWTDEGIQKNNT